MPNLWEGKLLLTCINKNHVIVYSDGKKNEREREEVDKRLTQLQLINQPKLLSSDIQVTLHLR